jgi:cell division protein FtsX
LKADFVLHTVGQQVRRHPRIVASAVFAFCLLAVVIGTARLGVRTVERWGALVGQNVHVIVYLSEDADPDVVKGLGDLLQRVPTVSRVTLVEPALALARLRAVSSALGTEPKTLEGLEPGYFPRSIEVTLAPTADFSQRAAELATRLRAVPGVAQVDAMTSGLVRLAGWVKLGRRLGSSLLVSCGLVSLAILAGVILRSRSTGRQQAAVLLDLGETNLRVRLPTGVWMAAAALGGGGLGALVLRLGWRPLLDRLESSLGITSHAPMPFLGGGEIVGGLAIVLSLGLVVGYFATPLPKLGDHA